MCFGVHEDSLMIRLGITTSEKIFKEPNIRVMDFTGKVLARHSAIQQNQNLT